MVTRRSVDAARYFPVAQEISPRESRGLSSLARGLIGSEILKISGEIRDMAASGRPICNLTVGDFSSTEFRIPAELEAEIGAALAAGQTNYPPSDGILELRREIVRFYEKRLGVTYPVDSIVICGGARPAIYATYKAIVDPGEKVLYPIPSWNNNHYTYLAGGEKVELEVDETTNFLPTAALLRPLIRDARLLCLNSPLNPTGTVLTKAEVKAIAELVVEENRRRERTPERPLFVMWDQVYWMLTFGGAQHFTPMELVPESTAWTIAIDGISKAFAATGLRVGWAAAPPYVTRRMRDILGHVGAWAPRPEQVATAKLLAHENAIDAFHPVMIREVRRRLDLLHDGFQQMKKDGLPVDSVAPQGAIYLSARFDLIGRRFGDDGITTNDEIRRLLLQHAGFAVVPFQAFGLARENGWMRLSIGAVSPSDIESGLARVQRVLERVFR